MYTMWLYIIWLYIPLLLQVRLQISLTIYTFIFIIYCIGTWQVTPYIIMTYANNNCCYIKYKGLNNIHIYVYSYGICTCTCIYKIVYRVIVMFIYVIHY